MSFIKVKDMAGDKWLLNVHSIVAIGENDNKCMIYTNDRREWDVDVPFKKLEILLKDLDMTDNEKPWSDAIECNGGGMLFG